MFNWLSEIIKLAKEDKIVKFFVRAFVIIIVCFVAYYLLLLGISLWRGQTAKIASKDFSLPTGETLKNTTISIKNKDSTFNKTSANQSKPNHKKPNFHVRSFTSNNTKNIQDTAKSTSKYDLSHATVDHSAVGDNASVTYNNYGIQPRPFTDNDMDFFERCYPDKSIYIGFVSPSATGDVINTKGNIIKLLKSRGYNNIESINGIRILLNDSIPDNIISLIHNQKKGVSFYIPPSNK